MWSKEEIGKVIKESRLSAGLTQMQVAETLGRPQNTISAWEMGRAQPDANTLFELFQILGRSVDEAFGFLPKIKTAPPYSEEALKLAEDYDSLDGHGKRIVRLVADEEKARCISKVRDALRKQREEMGAAQEMPDNVIQFRYSVPGYLEPMSAGTGMEIGQEYPENYQLIKEPPRGTSFIARVSGNSMEPTYQDGDLLFVHSCEEVRKGQIGVFFMDGRQWVKELGDGVLISHNPDYDPRPMTNDVRCQGLVLGVCDERYFE